MLEEINKNSDFLTSEKLYKVISFMKDTEYSIDSICDFFSYSKNKIISTMKFMCLINIVENNGCKYAVKDKKILSLSISDFNIMLCEKFLDYLDSNEQITIIPFDKIRYSNNIGYFIFISSISLKYSNIREFLISIGFFQLNEESNILIINKMYYSKLKKARHKNKHILKLNELKELLHYNEIYGEQAEEFVLNYEKSRIKNEELQKNIEKISELDVTAGYDIASYNSNNSLYHDRLIEVKSYNRNIDFYWSKNEVESAYRYKNYYFLYLVDRSRICDEGYEPIIIRNPIEILSDDNFYVEVEKYHIKKV